MPDYPWLKYKMNEGPLTVKEVHQGVNEQLNRKLGTDWGYSEYEWADLLQGFRPLPIKTASGSIAHFTDGADSVPLKSLTAQILPIQSGTGTPSPSNPRPISGTDELTLNHKGKNLFDNSLFSDYEKIFAYNVLKYTLPNDVLLTMSFTDKDTTINISDVYFGFVSNSYSGGNLQNNQIHWTMQNGTVRARTDNNSEDLTTLCSGIIIYPATEDAYNRLMARYDIQIELGSTATTYEPYNAETYIIDLGQEIIGGTADVVGGIGEETHGYIASYNGEAINEPWLSSIDPYVQGTTPSIGAEVVYPLTTPEPFTFDGVRVESLEGVNNVWTDSGDVTVEYRSNF